MPLHSKQFRGRNMKAVPREKSVLGREIPSFWPGSTQTWRCFSWDPLVVPRAAIHISLDPIPTFKHCKFLNPTSAIANWDPKNCHCKFLLFFAFLSKLWMSIGMGARNILDTFPPLHITQANSNDRPYVIDFWLANHVLILYAVYHVHRKTNAWHNIVMHE